MDRKRRAYYAMWLCSVVSIHCGLGFPLSLPTDDDATTETIPSTVAAIEGRTRYAIALGGVAPGRDVLVLFDAQGQPRDFSSHTLTFTVSDATVLGLLPRPAFADFRSGSGAQLIPQHPGSAAIHYAVDDIKQPEQFAAIVPPQRLIQILIGEARGVMRQEAEIVDGVVTLTSRSPTAEALAAVIRNRITLITASQQPGLFAANASDFARDPPTSAYDAVIAAQQFGVFQFAPVDPDDFSHESYRNAEARAFLDGPTQFAYDQAVLTAAGIFDGSISDPTRGAFAFRTPSSEEAACLAQAIATQELTLPAGCGPGDSNFPALAPVQVLIHPDVALLDDGLPAFVFYRPRSPTTPAVTNVP